MRKHHSVLGGVALALALTLTLCPVLRSAVCLPPRVSVSLCLCISASLRLCMAVPRVGNYSRASG